MRMADVELDVVYLGIALRKSGVFPNRLLFVSDPFSSVLVGKSIDWRSLQVPSWHELLDTPKFWMIAYLTFSDRRIVDWNRDRLRLGISACVRYVNHGGNRGLGGE